ncbi:MAG: WD40 repeat domain-containing protein [Candidatus Aminicenantes bacterium]|nr:WD40 repeat domain-containing protein [Candidatus Aminicenantes bacterium]
MIIFSMFGLSDKKIKNKWAGSWIGISINSESTRNKNANLQYSKAIKSKAKKVPSPVMISCGKPMEVGVSSETGKTMMWDVHVRIIFPNLADVKSSVIEILDEIRFQITAGNVQFDFYDFSDYDEALEWCNLGRIWKCNYSTRPSEHQSGALSLSGSGFQNPSITIEGEYASISRDNSRIVSSLKNDNKLMVWEAASGELFKTLEEPTGDTHRLAFSPNGQFLATAGSGVKVVRVWDLTTGKLIKELKGYTDTIWDVDFAPNGSKILTTGENVSIWDFPSGKKTLTFRKHGCTVKCATFFPDGSRVASGSFDFGKASVMIWEVKGGKVLSTFNSEEDQFSAISVTADGKYLAASGAQTSAYPIYIWDVNNEEKIKLLVGHTSLINSISISADGRYLVSGGYDCTVRLWDVKRGHELLQLPEINHPVFSVIFSSDGKWIITAGSDNKVKLWDASFLS